LESANEIDARISWAFPLSLGAAGAADSGRHFFAKAYPMPDAVTSLPRYPCVSRFGAPTAAPEPAAVDLTGLNFAARGRAIAGLPATVPVSVTLSGPAARDVLAQFGIDPASFWPPHPDVPLA
jgi:hypothetical protein